MECVRVAVIGVGRAGGAMGRALFAAGYPIAAVWSRTRARANALAAQTGARVASSPVDAACDAELVLLAVTDAQIVPLATALAAESRRCADAVVAHLSGASGAGLLAPLAQAGWRTAAFHPLQTFADEHSRLLPNTLFAIEADDCDAAMLTQVAQRLGGQPLRLAAVDRPLYHAAAAITANYTVTLISQAVGLLAQCGLSNTQALAALLPLLRGAVDNLDRVGLPDALTGPIVRGDSATVAGHLAALAARAPDVLPTYRALGTATALLAQARGTDASDLEAIRVLLEGRQDDKMTR